MSAAGYISEPVGGLQITRMGWLARTPGDKDTARAAEVKGGVVSVQVSGVFAGVVVAIEGSNDGKAYTVLTDPQGNPLNFRMPGLKQIAEQVSHIRPVLEGGGVDTSVDVILLVRSVA